MNVRRFAMIAVVLLATSGRAHADDRLLEIMMLWPSNDHATLRVMLNDALAAYGGGRDPRREATAYLFLSLIDIANGDQQNTRLHFGEATSRLEKERDYVGAALAYWMFAEHERLSERPSDHVLAFYEKALKMLEKAEDAPFSIDVLMLIGPVVGVPPDEYEPNRADPVVNRPIVLRLLEAFVRSGYGAEYLRAGDLENAEAQLRRAKEASLRFGGRIDPPIDLHIGNLRRQQGRIDDARASYMRALEGLKVLRPVGLYTPKRLRVEVFNELANLETLGGRIEEALAWHDRAVELVRAENAPEVEVTVLRRRAETLVRAGRFAAAEKGFAEAQARAEEHGFFHLLVTIRFNRARMHRMRGRHGAAAAELEKALEALANANEPFREAMVVGNLAAHYITLEANDSARLLLERARKAAEEHGRCLDVAAIELIESMRKYAKNEMSHADFRRAIEQWSRTPDAMSVPGAQHIAELVGAMMDAKPIDPRLPVQSGVVTDGMVELLQAVGLFGQQRDYPRVRELALQALPRLADARYRASAMVMIGGSYVVEENDDAAIGWFYKALDAYDTAAEEARSDPHLSSTPGDNSPRVFELLIPLLIKNARYEEAFAVSERARARVFLQLLGNSRVSPRGAENTLPAQEAETLRTQMLQWQQEARFGPAQQKLQQARVRYEALMSRVKATNPDYAAMTSVQPLQLEAIREELPAHTTLINYYVTTDSTHAWVLDRTQLQYVALPVGPEGLTRAECAARQFRNQGRGVVPLGGNCEAASVEELYERLFAPLREHIRNPRIVLVPHGVLHYLPFGAFRDERTGRYLTEDFILTYAPSASTIRFLRGKETPVRGNALVIGAPAGIEPALPGALREAMVVATELRVTPKVGAAAKESLLYELKGDVDLVHIAAHGFYEPGTPLFSRVALAEGGGYDGDLEVHEILSDVDLTGVNLVVLSACSTAAGKGSAGDEIVGLTRALLYAGTPGVISTLWEIGDHAAAALMDHFYCRLLSGDSAAEALRHAQLRMLRGDYAEPWQWAAFTLHGDPEGRWNASGALPRD